MWILFATLYIDYAIVFSMPGTQISASAPTQSTIVRPFESEKDCKDAMAMMQKYFQAKGRCQFVKSEEKKG